MADAYTRLKERFHTLGVMESAIGVLGWDAATTMPPRGAPQRGEQLATLQGMAHRLLCEGDTGELLDKAKVSDPWDAANLRAMRHAYLHASAVPSDLVEKLARAGSACEFTWRTAKKENDFAMLAPQLAEVLALVREVAAAKAGALNLSPYDALLDTYDPGRRSAEVDALFGDLGAVLPGFIDKAIATQKPATLPKGPYPVPKQEALGRRLMQALGFDFDGGRLDTSLHPFCSGTGGDIRITSRYDESDMLSSLMSVAHETGHALYEQHLPEEWRFQPVGASLGMSIHESQSLSVEMQLCRSRAFMEYLAPLAAESFGGVWKADALYAHATRVERSFIRVDADEVTYPLHVVLRYRLERRLISGALDVRDLPEAWNAGMKELLGITPPTDALGCMQDIHWMDGSFGYFPTYTLGALIAAQLFEKLQQDVPHVWDAAAEGDFTPATGWLKDRIHRRAGFHNAHDLVEEATGKPLGTAAFIRHLEQRYG